MAKSTKKITTKKISNENEMIKFIKMIIIVTIIFALFYILTMFINEKEKVKTNTDKQVSIQYGEILIGNIFNQSEKNYYVLVTETEDLNAKVYEAYLSNYSTKKDSKKYYTATLDNLFNSKYKAEETKLSNNLSELKFANTILLEIKDGKIIKSYETDQKIRSFVKQLTEEKTKEK